MKEAALKLTPCPQEVAKKVEVFKEKAAIRNNPLWEANEIRKDPFLSGNFFCYFPGGYYRELLRDNSGGEKSDGALNIGSSLLNGRSAGNLLKDIDSFTKEKKISAYKVEILTKLHIECMSDESPQDEKVFKELMNLILPVFIHLRKDLSYSLEGLIT